MEIRRRVIALAIAPVGLAALPFVLTAAPRALADENAADPSAVANVLRVEYVVPPRRKVVQRKFRPWSRPTPGQVREIIRNEARRWHIPAASLARRVACESRFHWWASNGVYQGVLQFAPTTFYRGLHTIRDRRVQIVRETVRRVHAARVTHYSDGRHTIRRITPRRQRLIVVYTGRLRRTPSVADTFAQLRIGAQAIRGISAVRSSEWACGA
jgi:hypothetical protein